MLALLVPGVGMGGSPQILLLGRNALGTAAGAVGERGTPTSAGAVGSRGTPVNAGAGAGRT